MPVLKLSVLAAASLFVGVTVTNAQTAEPLGIPACDEFMTKYEACIAKMPSANQATFKGTLDQMRTGWRGMAANPQTKGSLEGVCKQMSDSLKAAMTQAGCQW
jgi:hypothetical protein